MVFWALSEHRKVVQKHKDAGWVEGFVEGFAESFAESWAEGWYEGRAEIAKEYEAKLAAAKERARAEGIDLDKYLKP